MSAKPMPCPWCPDGGKTLVSIYGYVVCIGCQARGSSYSQDASAVAAWNAVAGLREMAEELARAAIEYFMDERDHRIAFYRCLACMGKGPGRKHVEHSPDCPAARLAGLRAKEPR